MAGASWVCTAIGFPNAIWFAGEDLSHADPSTGDQVISCRKLDNEELVRFGWHLARLLRILSRVPILP